MALTARRDRAQERKAKREEELETLKTAMCTLDKERRFETLGEADLSMVGGYINDAHS